MFEIDNLLWEQFKKSGNIDDYLAYKSLCNETEEEKGNANYN